MNTPAQDTAAYLVAQAITTAAGVSEWATYVGREPLSPDNVVTVYDTGGGQNVLVDMRKPTVQVRVRAVEYLDGWTKSDDIYKGLVTPVSPATTDGVTLQWVALTDIAYIGRDDDDRCLFTCNYQLLRDGA